MMGTVEKHWDGRLSQSRGYEKQEKSGHTQTAQDIRERRLPKAYLAWDVEKKDWTGGINVVHETLRISG